MGKDTGVQSRLIYFDVCLVLVLDDKFFWEKYFVFFNESMTTKSKIVMQQF